MKRRGLTLALAIIFMVSSFMGMTTSAFSDVSGEHKHSQAIAYLLGKGVINGYEDGSFKPEASITRAEFTKMMLEAFGFKNIYGSALLTTGFTDVDARQEPVTEVNEKGETVTSTNYVNQHWAAGYIKLAVDKQIVNGYGDGTFRPDAPVKYEEAIKMIVCCLGRDKVAKEKAQQLNIPLWPYAYLSVGNDFSINTGTDYALGSLATRSNIAQMLYNVKDVSILMPPSVIVGGGGGGGYTGGGGGSSGGNVSDSITVVSGLVTYGKVVAVDKAVGDRKKLFMIDDEIVIDGKAITSAVNKNIILKLDTPIESNDYQMFYTNNNDYSSYLGQSIKLTYRFDPDAAVGGRYEIEAIESFDGKVVDVTSKEFKTHETIDGIPHIVYIKDNEEFDQSLYTSDLNSLKILYNNKFIDTANYPISISDLMPKNGKIKIVDAYDDKEIDLIVVDSYETFVVGSYSFNTIPKKITDKFKLNPATGQPVELLLNDTSPDIQLTVLRNGKEIKVSDIKSNDILTVAMSKCGQSIVVIAEAAQKVENKISAIQGKNITIGDKKYELAEYFMDNVSSLIEFGLGDRLTVYTNSENKIIWAAIAEINYSTGYLVDAKYGKETGVLTLVIASTDGNKTTYTMADSGTRYITKATDCLVGKQGRADANGSLYRNLDNSLIFDSLKESADIINEGKTGLGVTENATRAQPIMYSAIDGKITALMTLEADKTNQFTGESLKYINLNGEYNFSNTDNTKNFSATSSSIFMFVPNNRTAYNANVYKIGTASSLYSKLIEYTEYNIEPYYMTDSTGKKVRTVFVVYNESIDWKPNYRSENIVVQSVEQTWESELAKNTVVGYATSTSSTQSYVCWGTDSYFDRAYVLDENFERKMIDGAYVRREVAPGDVIRLGYTPSGSVAEVEIILDASEDIASNSKSVAVSKYGEKVSSEGITSFSFKDNVYYYSRIGEITELDSSSVPEFCKINITGGAASTVQSAKTVQIGSGYSTKQVLLYDHTESDENKRLKTITMNDLWAGDMLYVWQGPNLAYKQVYAVRYPAVDIPTVEEPET